MRNHKLIKTVWILLVVACDDGTRGAPAPAGDAQPPGFSDHEGASAPAGDAQPPGFSDHEGALPTSDAIYSWISDVVGKGIRRPGMPAGAATEQYGVDAFRALGLDVALEEVPISRWVTVEGETSFTMCKGTCKTYEAFPTLSTQVTTELPTTPVVLYTDAEQDYQGKIVVIDYRMRKFTPGAFREKADWVFDPDEDIGDTVHADSRLQNSSAADEVDSVLKQHPAAVVCALRDFIDTPYTYGVHSLVPYDRSIPIILVSPSTSAAILPILRDASADGMLSVRAGEEDVVTHNVVARLPSERTDQVVLFGSHHDAPFYGATEDAAGIALVLAQAAYWSRVPASERPFEMVFVWTSAHLLRSKGAEAFVAAHPDLIARTVLDVHLETPAQEFDLDAMGNLVDQGRLEPHWFYTSRNPVLQAALKDAVVAENYRRTMMLDPVAFANGPPSDSKAFFEAGIPVLAHISNPIFYLTIADTLDKVNRTSLGALTRAVARTVWSLSGITAGQMRSGVTQ